jgi:hypothetical protein
VLASNHKHRRAHHESLEHADCRPVAHWSSTDRTIDTSSAETSCTSELSYRPAPCHHGSAQRTSIKSSRGRIPKRHRRLSRRHVLSMPGFCSQTAYIFRGPSVTSDSDAIGSDLCVDHDAMRPCCRRGCALSHVASVASLASFAGCTLAADIANQTHHAHAAWLTAFAQPACHADQVDCARLAVIARESPSANFASSANLAKPATGKATSAGRWSAESETSAAPRASLTSSLMLPPTGHLLFTSDKRTCITPLVAAFPLAHGIVQPSSAHSCIADFVQIKRSEKVSAL